MAKLKKCILEVARAINRDCRVATCRNVAQGLVFRWLSKTFCNVRAANRKAPLREFVRHAFGQPCDRPIRVFLAHWRGQTVALELDHIGYQSFWSDGGEHACVLRFFGCIFLLTNFLPSPEQQRAFCGIAPDESFTALNQNPRGIVLGATLDRDPKACHAIFLR